MTAETHTRAREFQMSIQARSNTPSAITSRYWLYSKRSGVPGDNEKTDRIGKWLVFVDIDEVDVVWRKIKAAVESGQLGTLAKVSTAKVNPNASDPRTKVICVYTYDHEDEQDVMRVRAGLRDLGIDCKIPYKTDDATRSGSCKNRGNTRISKYFV